MNIRRTMDMQIGAFTMSMATNVSGLTEPAASSASGLRHMDPDTDFKVRRITSYINEAVHMAANEPSLGLYRIQEHVHRTAPHLANKRKALKANNKRIDETAYDLNLSIDVVDSMRNISNFTRVHEALKTAIEMKKKLNEQDEKDKLKREAELKHAKLANRSISCNEPAEGYICPVCYFALTSQEELIGHWQQEHNLNDSDNDPFHEVEMPVEEDCGGQLTSVDDLTLEDDNDMTVIHSPKKSSRAISEGEDVVQAFEQCNDFSNNTTIQHEEVERVSDITSVSAGCSAESNIEPSDITLTRTTTMEDVDPQTVDRCDDIVSDRPLEDDGGASTPLLNATASVNSTAGTMAHLP